MQQKCKAVSWANAAAYQAPSVKAARGKWKSSSGGILGLKCSTQDGDQNQRCYQKPGPGGDQPSWFSLDSPCFSPENPKSQEIPWFWANSDDGSPNFPSPHGRKRNKPTANILVGAVDLWEAVDPGTGKQRTKDKQYCSK